MARARGANAKVALAYESIYGTPTVGGYHQIPFSVINLGDQSDLIPSDLNGYGRDAQDPDDGPIDNKGSITVPVDARNFGHWLKLLLGGPTTTGGTDDDPYTHVFKSGAQTLPSASVEIGAPEVPSFAMNYGVMADTLAITMQRSGLLSAQIGLLAQGEDERTSSTAAGTPAVADVLRFAQAKGEITQDGVQVAEIVSAQINYANNLDPDNTIRPDGRINGADPGNITAGAQIVTRFATTDLIDKATSKIPVALTFGWSIDANTSLVLAMPRVFLPKPQVPISGPAGIQVTFNVVAAKDDTAGCSFMATLVNDVTAYTA